MVKTFAIVKKGVVVNLVLSHKALENDWIESSAAKIGDAYIDGIFIPGTPKPQPEVTPDKVDQLQKQLSSLIDLLFNYDLLTQNDRNTLKRDLNL